MKRNTQNSAWEVVGNFADSPQAYIAKSILDEENIPVIINNDIISSVYPMTATWAPIQLLVPADLATRSRELLAASGFTL